MVLDNTLRRHADQSQIIISVIERLISVIPDLNEQNCFLCDQPIPVAMPGGRFCVTVSIGPGTFPHEFFGGGGTSTLTEDASIYVTPVIVTQVERPYRFFRKILGSKTEGRVPGLIYFKRAILSALIHDEWEPSDSVDALTEKPLLRELISPASCDEPHETTVGESSATAMKIRFATPFDWDLKDV